MKAAKGRGLVALSTHIVDIEQDEYAIALSADRVGSRPIEKRIIRTLDRLRSHKDVVRK